MHICVTLSGLPEKILGHILGFPRCDFNQVLLKDTGLLNNLFYLCFPFKDFLPNFYLLSFLVLSKAS